MCLQEAGGGLLATRPTHPNEILTQNLAEGKSSLCWGPYARPPRFPPLCINSLLTKSGGHRGVLEDSGNGATGLGDTA